MPNYALFLDRDGTINFDSGYVKDPKDVVLLPGVAESIKFLKSTFHFKVIVISNQAGIAYGIMTHDDVKKVNEKINALLDDKNSLIDAFYYCPFHPDYNSEKDSECRKPSPQMIVKASKDFNIELKNSYMIGDKSSDVLCGINAGVKTILITNNEIEINVLHNLGKKPNFVAANFKSACDFIANDFPEAVIE